MSSKPGRNDPCHCGSGRKYKHCHLREDGSARVQAMRASPQAGLEIALDWLRATHRKAFERAYETLIDDVWPDHVDALHPEDLEPDLQQATIANLGEHLLARGEIGDGEHWQSIAALVLAAGGPALTPAHRDYIAALASEPLRLYRIVEVRDGVGYRAVDVTQAAGDAAAQIVLEVDDPALAPEVEAGLLVGARLVKVGSHLERTRALYTFAAEAQADVADALAGTIDACIEDGASPVQADMAVELTLIESWLWQLGVPGPTAMAARRR